MHAVVMMVLGVTGTFQPWLVTIEICVAVVRKNDKANTRANDCVALQDVSLQRVCRHSSPASSSRHIQPRPLSLPPLFCPDGS